MGVCAIPLQAHQFADSLQKAYYQAPQNQETVDKILNKIEELWGQRHYSDALSLVHYAQELAQKINYRKGQSYASFHTAVIHYWLGNYQQSLSLSLKALNFFEEDQDHFGEAEIYHLLSKIHATQKSFQLAIDYEKQALALFSTYQDTLKISSCLNNIGVFYFEQALYNKALSYYLKVKELNLLLNDQYGLSITYNNLGEIHNRQDQPIKALPYFEKALEVAIPINDWLIIAHVYNEEGKAYTNLGEYQKAAAFLEKARKIAAEKKIRKEQLTNLRYTSKLLQKQQKFEEALVWQNRYLALKDSTHNERKTQQMLNLNISYETNKKNQQIESLKLQHMLEKERRENSQLISVIIAFAFILALGLGFFWWRLSKQRKLANRKLLAHQKDIERKNIEIQEHTDRLTLLNDAKSKLFSIISHDLRSPLGQLRAILSLLTSSRLSEEESIQIIRKISESVNYVNDLTENLLYWAKSQMGGIQMEPVVFDISDTASEICLLSNLQANKKKIQLTNQLEQPLWVKGDQNMMALVLRNLLSNAIKFTPEGGSVYVTSRMQSDKLVLCITDTGVGISKEKLPNLFSDITKSTRGTANEKGTGLGLQICHEFVTANQGEIWAESVEHKGSTFCFSLPNATKGEETSQKTLVKETLSSSM